MRCTEQPAAPRWRPPREDAPAADWRACLPPDWREQVVAPLDLSHHREYEMRAERCLGHDEDGLLCFYAHDYALTGLRSDDDEAFYTVIDFGERVRAWRLRDGRWLRYRQELRHEDPSAARGYYTFSESAPI
jgi:hypothetical protein